MKVLSSVLFGLIALALILASAANAADALAGPTTFTMPPAWERLQPKAKLTVLVAPEGDLRIAIAEVGTAADAADATRKAWQLFQPNAARIPTSLSPRPGRKGWNETHVGAYETAPAEHRVIESYARRFGAKWTVAIIEGSEATSEKRAAAANLVRESMRPAGAVRESFIGRKPHVLDRAKVSALVDFVRSSADALNVPGVGLAIIQDGRIVFEGGVGVRSLNRPDRVDEHTKFMIGSVTKSMTTLLLAKLADENRLDWDQPVQELFPAFRLGDDGITRKVLVRHLVCACTGLPRRDLEMLFATDRSTPAAKTFDLLRSTNPTTGFGEAYQYSNLLAAAAGYLGGHLLYPNLELGQAYDRAIQKKILDPLGMRETFLSMAEGLEGNHASPHSRDRFGMVRPADQDVNYALQPFRPSGGAWSTAHDMALFMLNEVNQGRSPDGRQLFSRENLTERWKRGVPIGEDYWYGMGLVDDASYGAVSIINHTGDMEGYHSGLFVIPSAGVGVVILTNSDDGSSLRWPLVRRLMEILYDGKPEAESDIAAKAKRVREERLEFGRTITAPVPSAQAGSLANVYSNPDLGRLSIVRHGSSTRFSAAGWDSEVGIRTNKDGTRSYVTIAPGLVGWYDFVEGNAAGKRTLTLSDVQRVYVFTEGAADR